MQITVCPAKRIKMMGIVQWVSWYDLTLDAVSPAFGVISELVMHILLSSPRSGMCMTFYYFMRHTGRQ